MVWVFGYGSLIWRPAIAYAARRAGRIEGWTRRFWQSSTDHRGTVEAPGRVLTLIESSDSVWGMAYAIERAAWPEIEAALMHREQQGYARVAVQIGLAAEAIAGPITERVPGLLFIATGDNPYFIGPESLEATAAIIQRSVGPSGPNLDYVLALEAALTEMHAHDAEVAVLASLLRAVTAR